MVSRLIQHLAQPHAILVSRPLPRAIFYVLHSPRYFNQYVIEFLPGYLAQKCWKLCLVALCKEQMHVFSNTPKTMKCLIRIIIYITLDCICLLQRTVWIDFTLFACFLRWVFKQPFYYDFQGRSLLRTTIMVHDTHFMCYVSGKEVLAS